MKASVGDRIVVKGLHLGEPDRDGEILAVEGPDGSPPCQVRWEADGHVSLFFPSSDVSTTHRPDRTGSTPPDAGWTSPRGRSRIPGPKDPSNRWEDGPSHGDQRWVGIPSPFAP